MLRVRRRQNAWLAKLKDDQAGRVIHLREAIKLKPGYADAQNNLQAVLKLKASTTNQPEGGRGPKSEVRNPK